MIIPMMETIMRNVIIIKKGANNEYDNNGKNQE